MKNSELLNLFGQDIPHNGELGTSGGWYINYGYYIIFIHGQSFINEHNISISYCGQPLNADKMSKPKHIGNIHSISFDSSPKEVAERVATILNWCIKNKERENEKVQEWAANKSAWC